VFLSAGGVAVFLSYIAVMSGVAPGATVGPVSIAAVAFPGLVTGFVVVAYVAWETRNVRLASSIADELNAQLLRKEIELGRVSTLDELTRLFSAREFERSLRLEFERRRRYGRDLSLLLLDADQVTGASETPMSKTYVLSEVASVFRKILRANDIGGRVTHDRLGLLLPETDEIRAQLVADKIRAVVGSHEFLGAGVDGAMRVRVSAGIAVADDEFETPDELMSAAETALGEAIAAGNNHVSTYQRPRPSDDDGEAEPYRLAS
jgi:diguanylate cyclase (GGDEF)-like protein